jgi:hypothetical protein
MAAATRRAIGAPEPACERELLTQTRAWLLETAGSRASEWTGPLSLAVVAGHLAELGSQVAAESQDTTKGASGRQE